MPADGFFEWVRKGKEKQPIRFILEHEPLFAFAGLWDEWKTQTSEALNTFTIITVPANKTVEPIHNRMPVILDESNWKEWIDPREPVDKACAWLKPYSGKKMEGYPGSKEVNLPAKNDPACTERLATGEKNNCSKYFIN